MVQFSKIHGAMPGIAPRMQPKLYFQPLSGLQSSQHSREHTASGAVKQELEERRRGEV